MGVIWNWACALLFLTAAVSSTLFYNPSDLSESVTQGVMSSPNTSDSGFSSSQEEWIRQLVASHAASTSTPTASSPQSGAQTQSTTATTTGSSQQGSLGKPMRCISFNRAASRRSCVLAKRHRVINNNKKKRQHNDAVHERPCMPRWLAR